MKQTKRFIAAAATATLVVTAVTPVMAEGTTFTDIKGHSHEQTILSLVNMGIIKGYPDGTFRPNQVLTRSDVVKLLGKYLVSLGHEIPADYKTNMRFTDLTVKSEDELLQLAALVKDLGVFNGSSGKLNPKDQMRRDQMATVLVRAFNVINEFDYIGTVKGTNFTTAMTDVGRTTEEHQDSIAVFEYYKITNQKEFSPKDPAKRGQFATFLYNLLKVETPKPEEETPLTPEIPVVPAEPEAPLLLLQSVEVQEKDKLRVVLSDDKAYIVTLATPLVEDVPTEVSFEISGQLYTTTATYKIDELQVSSITNPNASQFVVTFSQPVDLKETLSEATMNELIVATGIDSASPVKLLKGELSEDKKQLTVTTNATPILEGRYRIAVAGIQSEAKAELIKFDDIVTFDKDTVGPAIESVTSTAPMKIKVKFTEPIRKTQAPTKFNLLIGKEVKGVTGTIEKNATEVEYDFSNARVDGALLSASVTLQATFGILFDVNNNESEDKPLTAKFTLGDKDGERPEVQNIEQYGGKTFKITFSEEVRDLAATDFAFDWASSVALKATSVAKDEEDPTSYIVTTNSELKGNITIKTAAGKYIRDLSGETNTFSTKFEFITDKVNPSVVSTEVIKDDGTEYVELTFDRSVEVKSSSRANAEGSYVIDGITHDLKNNLSAKVVKNKGNNKKVRIKLAELLDGSDKVGANYYISLEFEKLNSDYGQSVNDVDYVTFKRSTDSEHNDSLLKVKSIETSVNPGSKLDNQTVVITFNHAVDGLAAFDIENYQLDGLEIERAKITAADPDKVELKIKETYSDMQFGAALTISNLRAAGSDLAMDDVRQIVYFNESVRPYNISDVTMPDDDEIELYFTEPLENVLISSFIVEVEGKKATISSVKASEKADSNGHYPVKLTLLKPIEDGDDVEISLNSKAKITDEAKNEVRFNSVEFTYDEDRKMY